MSPDLIALILIAAVTIFSVAFIGAVIVRKSRRGVDSGTATATLERPAPVVLDVPEALPEAAVQPPGRAEAPPQQVLPAPEEATEFDEMIVEAREEVALDEADAPTAEAVDLTALVEEEVVLDEPVDLEVEAPPEVAPPAPAPAPAPPAGAPAPGRFVSALQKTRGFLGERLAILTRRDRVDEDSWDEIEEALIRADVGVRTTVRVVEALKELSLTPETLSHALRDELVQVLRQGGPTLKIYEGRPSVWLVTGVNGVGKTTSIAKMAHRLKREGHSVVLVAADTFRAAAIEQLGTWAERVGVHMVRHDQGADPGAVVFDAIQHAKARGIEVVIVDTAGRLHTKSNLMEELKKVRRIAEREAGDVAEALLVLDATVGQNGIAQAKTFQEAIDVTGVILTKLDGTARGGIVMAVQEELGIPVKAIGTGETLDDIEPFEAEEFVVALLGS